jgi:hypothetical protein
MIRNRSDAYHRKGKQVSVYKLDGTDKLTDVFDRISVTRSISCINAPFPSNNYYSICSLGLF